MIIAKVRKSGRYDAKKYADKIAHDLSLKISKNLSVRETPCYFFVETMKLA